MSAYRIMTGKKSPRVAVNNRGHGTTRATHGTHLFYLHSAFPLKALDPWPVNFTAARFCMS